MYLHANLNNFAYYLEFQFQSDPDTNKWILLPINLRKAIREPAVFLLDVEDIPC